MSTKKSWVLGSLLVGALSIAAGAPVAMRVEIEPLRQAGAATEVAVVVQVSPEDRARIGANAILRIELDGGKVSSGSPMRAVWLEDDGSARVVVVWPPGEHHLRVGIEDPSKEDTGLWVGTVRIPDLSPDASIREVEESPPDPDPVPVPDLANPAVVATPEPEVVEEQPDSTPTEATAVAGTVAPASAATDEIESEPEVEALEPVDTIPETPEEQPVPQPPAETEDAIDAAAATTAASTIVEPPTPEPEPEIPEPTTPSPTDAEESIDAAVAAAAASTAVEPPDLEPEPESESVPTPEIPEPVASPVAEAEALEEPPLVEPLRADPPPQTAEPEAVAPRHPEESAAALVPVSAELAARYEEWGSADPEIREFSMIVTRGRDPAMDVEASDFQLRVGGSRVPIEGLGGAERAPLLLGLAMDVAADEVADWSGMQGSLSPIVDRAGGDRGQLFVATSVGVGAWDADMDAPGGVTLSKQSDNVARLVIASIESFEGRSGRTFLVVLTDGRNEPTKEEWQEATEKAGEAGVPILVIALWDEKFNTRTRKSLKKLTDVSGGSLFLVQGRAQLESAADRFGRYLDGGYSVRFRSPGGDPQTATAISVSASSKDLDVSAPKSIR